MAVQERLRILHAEQAERLALASWRDAEDTEYHLIDNPDLRLAIGPLLGKIAYSHWWPVSRLGNEFGTIRGALTNCPREWTLDPLKVAVLLRTADAAHLDERRAPGFLIALRRPEGISEIHWRFQNHLLKPCIPDDRLIYTTSRPFSGEEADAWWLCEETLRTVDRGLQQSDALLYDLSRPRLRAKGVAGTESPLRLQGYIEVSGWVPVDARLHVSNVADLVRRLGGEQLYGDKPYVALRELIQNASDGVRARRVLQNLPADWGRVTVRLGRDEQGAWIEVEDTGIGMSRAVLTGPLLDFGTTYWGSTFMREEHEGLWAKGFEPAGRFGIGFFSVFMLGHRVRVITRRYEYGQRDTEVLEFRTGLEARPLVRPAEFSEQLREGGTCVRVWLNKEPTAQGGILILSTLYGSPEVSLASLCAWLAPSLDVDLFVEEEGESRLAVSASDWLTLDEVELIGRLGAESFEAKKRYEGKLLSEVRGSRGEILGRGAFLGREFFDFDPYERPVFFELGVITVGGLRTGNMASHSRFRRWASDSVVGIFLGSLGGASRDSAVPLANRSILAGWASGQAELASAMLIDLSLRLKYAAAVVAFGGDPGQLPVAEVDGDLLDREMIENWREVPGEIILAWGDSDLADQGIFPSDWPCCVMWLESEVMVYLIKDILSRVWDCPIEEIAERHVVVEYSRYREIEGVILKRPDPDPE